MDKNIVDTTTPIESVKVVASKFGDSMNWKTRKTQTTHATDKCFTFILFVYCNCYYCVTYSLYFYKQASDRIVLELDKLKNEISECKHQTEAAEAAKLSLLKEVERTKKLSDEM
jgi:hypothetical protein